MVDRALYWLTFTSAIGCLIVAGIFFAFSNFIMPALGRITEAQGVAAMNSINLTVINPLFMLALFGTALVCVAVAGGSFLNAGQSGKWFIVAAALIYVIGCTGVTMIFNVPLNDALAAVPLNTPQATELWQRYLGDWTFWNSVRTGASLVSGTMLIAALAGWQPAS